MDFTSLSSMWVHRVNNMIQERKKHTEGTHAAHQYDACTHNTEGRDIPLGEEYRGEYYNVKNQVMGAPRIRLIFSFNSQWWSIYTQGDRRRNYTQETPIHKDSRKI